MRYAGQITLIFLAALVLCASVSSPAQSERQGPRYGAPRPPRIPRPHKPRTRFSDAWYVAVGKV